MVLSLSNSYKIKSPGGGASPPPKSSWGGHAPLCTPLLAGDKPNIIQKEKGNGRKLSPKLESEMREGGGGVSNDRRKVWKRGDDGIRGIVEGELENGDGRVGRLEKGGWKKGED